MSRDVAGIPFANSRPFLLHQYSLARLQARVITVLREGLIPVSLTFRGLADGREVGLHGRQLSLEGEMIILTPDLWLYIHEEGAARGAKWHRMPSGCRSSVHQVQAGLPFPVSCCWNGLAVINAAPFRAGYQYRHAA